MTIEDQTTIDESYKNRKKMRAVPRKLHQTVLLFV
jgi:hypothetical protein